MCKHHTYAKKNEKRAVLVQLAWQRKSLKPQTSCQSATKPNTAQQADSLPGKAMQAQARYPNAPTVTSDSIYILLSYARGNLCYGQEIMIGMGRLKRGDTNNGQWSKLQLAQGVTLDAS